MEQIMLQYIHKQEKFSLIKKRRSFSTASIEQGESRQSTLTPTIQSTADLKIDWEKFMFCQQMTYKKEKGNVRIRPEARKSYQRKERHCPQSKTG